MLLDYRPAVEDAFTAQLVAPSSINPTSAVGAPSITAGGVTVAPTSISSTASVGVPIINPGSVTITPVSIGPTSSLGAPTISGSSPAQTVVPNSITPTSALGVPTISAGGITVIPSSITSTLGLGIPSLNADGVVVQPQGINSTLSLGAPTISSPQSATPACLEATASLQSRVQAIAAPGSNVAIAAGLQSSLAASSGLEAQLGFSMAKHTYLTVCAVCVCGGTVSEIYHVGDVLRLELHFQTKNASGVLVDTDPTTLAVTVKDGATTTTYTAAQADHPSTGAYVVKHSITSSGTLRWKAQGTGAAAAVEEGQISVRATQI